MYKEKNYTLFKIISMLPVEILVMLLLFKLIFLISLISVNDTAEPTGLLKMLWSNWLKVSRI